MTDLLAERPFSFGRNWERFVAERYSDERLLAAQKHLLDFLDVSQLTGRTFLDAGSGSGLHSAAAWRAGAKRIISFDIDAAAVRTTARVRELCGTPENWTVLQGSVLDREFLNRLGRADVVYSWGVLHHTGNMWQAMANVARLIAPGGQLCIGLYVSTAKSDYWVELKKRYNASTEMGKRCLEAWHIARYHFLPSLVRLENPLRLMLQPARGMSFMTDVRDWLGGYPYQDATIQEVVRFYRRLGLSLANLQTNLHSSVGFAEYLFGST